MQPFKAAFVLALIVLLASPVYAQYGTPSVPMRVMVQPVGSHEYVANIAPLERFHVNRFRTYQDLYPYKTPKPCEYKKTKVKVTYRQKHAGVIANPGVSYGQSRILHSTSNGRYLVPYLGYLQ